MPYCCITILEYNLPNVESDFTCNPDPTIFYLRLYLSFA